MGNIGRVRTTGALCAIAAAGGMAAAQPAAALSPAETIGGDRITLLNGGPLCTTGFAFTIGGGKFMATAGHCNSGNPVNWYTVNPNAGSYLIGNSGYAVNDGRGDFQLIVAPNARGGQRSDGGIRKVNGAVDPSPGDRVCWNGAGTGHTVCAFVKAPTAFQGANEFCVDQPAIPGDSGAGVWKEAGADVTVVGIIDNAGACGTKVSSILSAYNGQIVTECSL